MKKETNSNLLVLNICLAVVALATVLVVSILWNKETLNLVVVIIAATGAALAAYFFTGYIEAGVSLFKTPVPGGQSGAE